MKDEEVQLNKYCIMEQILKANNGAKNLASSQCM